MDFRKTYFILPNLFTLASVFCGLYSIVLTARLGEDGGTSDEELLYKAALAIVLGLLFDGADGRIARLTKTQSDLGVQLDSLADVITFGVAPAILVYRWGLLELGRVGLFVAFVFTACGALRLARFNVLAMREQQAKAANPATSATPNETAGAQSAEAPTTAETTKKKPAQFIGLPIPIAANMIVALVLANHAIGVTKVSNHAAIAGFVLVLSYLMISRVRFRSFKDLKFNKRSVTVMVLVLAIAIVTFLRVNGPAVLIGMLSLFVVLGLAEEVVFYRRRRREELAEKRADEPDDDEREVLEELGANG
ncbi:CDP-diacylglycerol--serine O-phosphatidyltransferase [Enhygromyxa salina]|uniref:CDP-diacylglycerol--serine O-phosphatidyltransferase n=1 Tax=Enhygromyxa salina TaxID=215803 RepID=A0A0C1Z8B0_9BACT|nr:CDP-diacylglycerol--serine O-phosphatidyltransferase [Enhygromyxa salina]KIG13879.1 CDP-diacylglycerol--serine O-phosphatidyltransferase [Enhygromyxa salina]